MQQAHLKVIKEHAWLGGEKDPLGIVQETEIWSHLQMVNAQSWICPSEWNKILWDFESMMEILCQF